MFTTNLTDKVSNLELSIVLFFIIVNQIIVITLDSIQFFITVF